MTATPEGHDREQRPAIEPRDLPDPNRLPEMIVYGHSTLFYWWPVWALGLVLALLTWLRGGAVELDAVRQEVIHPSSGLGTAFVVLLLLVILFTNVTLRGIYSVVFVLTVVVLTLLLSVFGWWDEVFSFVPMLSIHMNLGFYLVFSLTLMVLWALQFFVFDRMVYWRVRPGQLIEEHVIGGAEQTYDARGMLFEQRGDDLFRHTILGLGTADLVLRTTGARTATIEIHNVLFADKTISAIQKLVAVEPDDLMHGRTERSP